ncbi:uncharacterized protein DUF397 [Actinorugispora endophytica]|uniref:Uncharacterized protein DUF397 n=2 Tax=Actinorugispora endophytica TaxID=1605990 RepID=A0A4R6V1G8_9ACTN|nr:uncharacterized protein DUF397 [Actinorugispora endophytica]
MSNAHWRKSSYSTAQSNCVEVADLPERQHAVRDTQNRAQGGHLFPREEWTAFIQAVKATGF